MARQRPSSTNKTSTATSTSRKPTRARKLGDAQASSGEGSQPLAPVSHLATAARSKFTLYNLQGKPRAHYLVEREEVERPRRSARQKTVAHSIIIIDRSGSMYSYLGDLKDTLLKLLTLDEYSQYDLLVTLISYSSEGDCQVHFQRSAIQEIMKPGSKQLKEIKKIQVTGLTCISQSLQLAASLCKDEELTCITLHSDGYANHPSATTESKTIEKLCHEMQKMPVFVNTIAYTDYSDFRLLSRVANTVSGSCLRAGSIKQVYDSLYNTEKLLGSSLTPPLEIPLPRGFTYQVFVSHSGDKLLGAGDTLHVRGIKEEDDASVYRFRPVSFEEYNKLKEVPEAQTSEPVLAFARTQLSEGNINTAKYALASSFDATLVERHGRALTNLQVAALAQDLETVLFQPGILQEHEVLDRVPVNERISILALVRLLAEHRDSFQVSLEHLKQNYIRRGLRRLQGTRDENGKLVEPTLKAETTDAGDYASVSSFDINRNTANLNMLIARPVRLVPAAGGKPITEVAGIKLDRLMTFNNYTLVGDGELNVPTLTIRISQKKLFDLLRAEGVLEQNGAPADKHDPKADYTLRLDLLPLVPPFDSQVDLEGVFEELAELKVLQSIVSAHLKEDSDQYTEDQVQELKKHYLSKNLYLNFPTTNEYTDLQQALAEGTVDYRTSYKIDIGNSTILNLGKLMSGNKFLDRMYELIDAGGQKIDKPSFEALLDGNVSVRHKQLSARTKVTAVDGFMRRIFDDFLGLDSNKAAVEVLERVGAKDLARIVQDRARGKKPARKEYVAALTDAQRKLDAHAARVFEARISPLVFYIGSTGVLPDEMDTPAMSAEKLQEAHPDLSLSKDEQEGLFFPIGDTILSVYAKSELFSR